MKLSAPDLARVCAATAANAALYARDLGDAMEHFHIDGLKRGGMFLAAISFESARFNHVEENLGYSALRMTKVWPRRFPTVEAAKPYAMNPKALAENVYGGRMGNVSPGDGWKYRGRGLKMLTGFNNYSLAKVGLDHLTGEDYVFNPDAVAQPKGAAWTAAWFWSSNGLSAHADAGDFEGVCRIINGGLTGYEDGNAVGMDDRVEYWAHVDTELQRIGVLS